MAILLSTAVENMQKILFGWGIMDRHGFLHSISLFLFPHSSEEIKLRARPVAELFDLAQPQDKIETSPVILGRNSPQEDAWALYVLQNNESHKSHLNFVSFFPSMISFP